jgi:hypothetical protein
MLELRIMNAGTAVPLLDLPAALGRRGAAREIGDTIEGLIAFMNELGGDPDVEDCGDIEPDGDDRGDLSWPEWHTRGRHKLRSDAEMRVHGLSGLQLSDDDEDDDPDSGVEDDPRGHCPEEDYGGEELGEMEEGVGDTFTTPMALVEQRDRIRRTRCVKHMSNYGGNRYATWRLRSDAPCGREVDHGE